MMHDNEASNKIGLKYSACKNVKIVELTVAADNRIIILAILTAISALFIEGFLLLI